MISFFIGAILCVFAISATAQTNEPVIRVKEFKADNWTNRITLGVKGSARTLRGDVLAVYSNRFMLEVNDSTRPDLDGKQVIIQNYPGMAALANGQKLAFYAIKVGTIQGVNEDGTPAVGEVLELWDYYDAKAEAAKQQIEAEKVRAGEKEKQRIKAAEQKTIAAARALKANEDAAAKGEAYGLLRMGERYRDGEGVDKDLTKAKDYLLRAMDAGSITAKAVLEKLNQP